MTSIQVFEHQTLRVGEQGFLQKHYHNLVKYNDQHQQKYFTVGFNKIKFANYVGVIKSGNVSIEILPKVGKEQNGRDEKNLWQNVLIKMLQTCKLIKTHSDNKADLKLRPTRLLDVIYLSFLAEVLDILHKGKVKKYRNISSNIGSLKGRLMFPENIKHNLIHKQRFFTEHQSYDFNNIFNIALKKALEIISITAFSKSIVFESNRLLCDFETVEDKSLNEGDFVNIKYDRNTEKYRNAIELARLIIFNHQPDIMTGKNNVVALLFDMNMLFEEYVYRLLRRTASSNAGEYEVLFQKGKQFWGTKCIRPDMRLIHKKTNSQFVIDTKWKVPKDNKPSDSDLKQMFVYNIHFGAKHSYLVYPYIKQNAQSPIAFKPSVMLPDEYTHSCQMLFLNIFDEDKNLNRNAANQIYENISKLEGARP